MSEADASGGFEERTRAIFDAHHREQADDDRIYERLVSLVSPDYFGLGTADFAGCSIADVGCGSNANASVAFLRLGAAHVHSVDLGDEWMDCAARRLSPFGSRSTMGSDDVLELSLETAAFDFVHCAGVLHHTADPSRGFRELARITRPGGHTFVTAMGTADGVIYRIVNALRDIYVSEPGFRSLVDGLTAADLRAAIEWTLDAKEGREPTSPSEREVLLSLVDEDLVLTAKDRLQAPTYHGFALDEVTVRRWFDLEGFSDVRRISRYTYGFRNLRRFLAPLYSDYASPIARLLFGDGYVQMIGRRSDAPDRSPRG